LYSESKDLQQSPLLEVLMTAGKEEYTESPELGKATRVESILQSPRTIADLKRSLVQELVSRSI